MSSRCPACESGRLVARVADRTIRFEGKTLRVENLQYSECPVCGEQVVLPAQAKRNEVAYANAKKADLSLWSCGKIEAFRKEWKMTQSQAAKLFGGGVNAFSKYERGEVIHSKSMDLLMRVFDEVEEAREVLCKFAGITLDTVPAWETVTLGPAPKRRANANDVIRHYGALKDFAANGERWETCEVAHGP